MAFWPDRQTPLISGFTLLTQKVVSVRMAFRCYSAVSKRFVKNKILMSAVNFPLTIGILDD